VEASLLIHFCRKLKESGLDITRTAVLANLYRNQLKKAGAAVAALHEDLQYDLNKELEPLLAKQDTREIFGFLRRKR
jgi:hypothetical protein